MMKTQIILIDKDKLQKKNPNLAKDSLKKQNKIAVSNCSSYISELFIDFRWEFESENQGYK